MKRIALLSLIAAVVTPGLARADSSITVRISAHVDVFCHIYPPSNDQITVVNGEAKIGEVREVCNTPDGYSVTTAFTNLSAGRLEVGGDAYTLDKEGMTVRNSSEPAVLTQDWRLEHAQLASAAVPVIMQVTISPR